MWVLQIYFVNQLQILPPSFFKHWRVFPITKKQTFLQSSGVISRKPAAIWFSAVEECIHWIFDNPKKKEISWLEVRRLGRPLNFSKAPNSTTSQSAHSAMFQQDCYNVLKPIIMLKPKTRQFATNLTTGEYNWSLRRYNIALSMTVSVTYKSKYKIKLNYCPLN